MKKENREMAKQRKAQERKKAEQVQKIKKVMMYGVPIVLGAAIIIGISAVSAKGGKSNASNTESTAQGDTSSGNETFDTDTNLTVKDGDTVNIDYVGTVDGVEFSGGNTNGMGTDLTIGSGSYIDDFEEQLIGHHVGETVEVTVTFPENYGVEELNGKEAVFTTNINGIY